MGVSHRSQAGVIGFFCLPVLKDVLGNIPRLSLGIFEPAFREQVGLVPHCIINKWQLELLYFPSVTG